jgi:hypothetical protein
MCVEALPVNSQLIPLNLFNGRLVGHGRQYAYGRVAHFLSRGVLSVLAQGWY